MGGFVTLFNYIGYRLLDAPYSLTQNNRWFNFNCLFEWNL